MRVTDVCPCVDDAVAIAALFRCLCRMLYRLRRANQGWRHYSRFLLAENRWQAQRHGSAANLIDFGQKKSIAFKDLVDEISELVAPDAAFFGCEAEIAHIRTIAERGTSADRQLALAGDMTEDCLIDRAKLEAVVDQLVHETQHGLAEAPASAKAG
jgi:carboxylate-amine ligase